MGRRRLSDRLQGRAMKYLDLTSTVLPLNGGGSVRRKLVMAVPIAIASLLSLTALPARAQEDYPSRPIRFIVPVAAGGLTDILTRVIGERLQERLGQPVVVDNKAGAGGIIGMEAAARAASDGYTLAMSYIGVAAVNPSLYKNLPYDPIRDFVPVSLVANFPMVLMVHPGVPVNSVSEFVSLLKAKPGELNYGSAGNATTSHLAMELFLRETGTKMVHVPYKGAAPAMTDLLAGRLAASFDSLTLALPQVKAGKIRALGIASRQPSALAPEIPTIAEEDVPGFEVTGWYGVLAPRGTPKPIVDKLSKEFAAIVNEPEMRAQLASRGIEPVGTDSDAFSQLLREETEKWRRVVNEADIHVN
jgi:tripartite-type tricarboxylate transporter receptor subunit TctC